MKRIALTLRVSEAQNYLERRDALDQRWPAFLTAAGYVPLLLPNHLEAVAALLRDCPVAGILLTGGNSPQIYGGDAPERDAVDAWLIAWARKQGQPLLGVCRGMQSLQMACGQSLEPVSGQILAQQRIRVRGQWQEVNSYHTLGTYASVPELDVWAQTETGLVKAVRHREQPLWGVMWHPERLSPFRTQDLHLFQEIFQ